jgi:hypothetical protein
MNAHKHLLAPQHTPTHPHIHTSPPLASGRSCAIEAAGNEAQDRASGVASPSDRPPFDYVLDWWGSRV